MMEQAPHVPVSLVDLRLPPAFFADHCIRTLSYQGAMSAVDIAKHWRVRDSVAIEVVESLKASGLVRSETGPADLDRLGRVRLSEAGQARVSAARERTWYAGPLPVSLANLGRLADTTACGCSPASVRAELAALAITRAVADEIGQAIVGGSTLALAGAAWDEQAEIASALGSTLTGQAQLPYAVFAAGSVVRVFDHNYHRVREQHSEEGEDLDVLRSHGGERTQWVTVAPPLVTLAGGIHASDVLPAYDQEAKFYLAPLPFAACGGILCVMDSASDPAALADLARLWLIPGRQRTGIVLLRSGERIEVPWKASAVLFNATEEALPAAVRDTVTYRIDIAELQGEAIETFIARRLDDAAAFPPSAVSAVAEWLGRAGLYTRAAAASAAQYLRHRAAYEGAGFSLDHAVLQQAIDFASQTPQAPRRRAAGDLRAA